MAWEVVGCDADGARSRAIVREQYLLTWTAILALGVGTAGCGERSPAPLADADSAQEPPTLQNAGADRANVAISPFAGLYEDGIEFSAFLANAEERRETWQENYLRSTLSTGASQRASALAGAWRLLVVAEDWCGDSANTIPYLARLVEAVDGLEMRIVDSNVGRSVMEAHRTPDGRPATPTVLVLDDSGREAGCWVERPTALQNWFLENEGRLQESDLYDRKYAWYDRDAGEQTISDVIAVLEGAVAGQVVCPAEGGT